MSTKAEIRFRICHQIAFGRFKFQTSSAQVADSSVPKLRVSPESNLLTYVGPPSILVVRIQSTFVHLLHISLKHYRIS